MTDQLERSTDDVLQELKRVGEAVDTARRVIIIGGGHRAALVGCLNEKLASMGLAVTAADPAVCVPVEPEPVGPLFQTFGQILACPSLRHLFGDMVEPPPVLTAPEPNPDPEPCTDVLMPTDDVTDQIREQFRRMLAAPGTAFITVEPEQAPAPTPEPVPNLPYRAVLMKQPKTWTVGDVFEDHPRYVLASKRRKWVYEGHDDLGVELRSPNTSSTDLVSLELFQTRYVFHSHAQTLDV